MSPNQPQPLDNSQLFKALSHPTRTNLMKALSERSETPKNLAQELGCSIRHIEYHLSVLEKLSCVELVKTETSPGGKVLAHHYRSLDWLWFDRENWPEVDPRNQPPITMGILRSMSDDLAQALLAGTIDEGGNHISRTRLVLDAVGYEQLLILLEEILNGLKQIRAESSERLEEGDEQISTTVHITQFISPEQKGRD